MNKFVSVIVLLLAVSLISCSQSVPNPADYVVFEVGGYDNVSDANHQSEVNLSMERYSNTSATRNKVVKVNEKDWNVNYTDSTKGYLYHNDIDYYQESKDDVLIEVGINSDTGATDVYIWDAVNGTEQKEGDRLTEQECLDVAKMYLNRFVDSDEYEVLDVRYLEFSAYEAIYKFEFARIVNGVKTLDSAQIGVSVFGDVVSHVFLLLGEMKHVSPPRRDELQAMQKAVEMKLDTIYENVSDKYSSISYEIDDIVFVRLSDGRYALEYSVGVDLTFKDSSTKISEATKLLIYLDD